MSFISSFEIIIAVVPEPWVFLWILESIPEAAAVIPNDAKIFLPKDTTFINGPGNLLNNGPKIPQGSIILEIWDL